MSLLLLRIFCTQKQKLELFEGSGNDTFVMEPFFFLVVRGHKFPQFSFHISFSGKGFAVRRHYISIYIYTRIV